MAPHEIKSGSVMYSHGIEVYQEHKAYQSEDNFQIEKWAWIDTEGKEPFRKVKELPKNKVYMMNPPKFDRVHDMAELVYMHEPSVTYSGLFLVAINPYRKLPIYSTENIRGESGAGKTENTKIAIQYLASIAGNGSNGFGADSQSKLEEQILQANPILEAFGNAQTIRNNNSSRFGKFIRIAFNRYGDIKGAFIDWYLLETSRVHTQTLEERNYHIFYQLLNASKEMKEQLVLKGKCPADFNYTKNSNHTIQGVDDAAEYNKLIKSMDIMGITTEERLEFFRIVAAVLYLGNTVVNHNYSRVDISHYEMACDLLGVSPQLFKKHLLEPQIKAGHEWVGQAKSFSQVKDNLDALCKVLYERNFSSLVSRINSAIDGPKSMEGMSISEGERFIGVLDIAGFEIFKINSFEQLCINYTNEKLQDFFNQNMFVLEEQEYRKENITCDDTFDYRNDLRPTISLIENVKNPIGILSCLEDECVTQGTDERLLAKISEQNMSNPRYKRDIYNEGFSVKHYAGEVKYSTEGWIDKSKDPLNEHVARLFAESKNQHVATLFKDYSTASIVSARADLKKTLGRTRKGGGNFHTVGYKHKQQLSLLMNTLHTTRPHFVRCILPNDRKRPGEIQSNLVLHQLRCNGVLEGIRICRVGYPNRMPFEQFREQYKLLCPEVVLDEQDSRKACQLLLYSVNKLTADQYQIGRTKVFFKAGILGDLEEQRNIKLSDIFIKIQAGCLGLIARRRVLRRQSQVKLIRVIQRNSRIYIDIMQSRLWKVFHRRKELQYTFGEDNAFKKKIDDLEQILAATQEEFQMVNRNQLKQIEYQETQHKQMVAEYKDRIQRLESEIICLEEENNEWVEKYHLLEERYAQLETDYVSTKEVNEEQATMLSKLHEEIKEESDENESLMIQCDDYCKENNELQEKIQLLEERLVEREAQNKQLWADLTDVGLKHNEELGHRDSLIIQLQDDIQVIKKHLQSHPIC
ncbi:P-loop containing nucleoside triphosphate hydrolase protein [Pilobolus umbonatus]|nr:P-loop containing nucleoside triphosphate hydrolase protein [Pilobolus umbonatus]